MGKFICFFGTLRFFLPIFQTQVNFNQVSCYVSLKHRYNRYLKKGGNQSDEKTNYCIAYFTVSSQPTVPTTKKPETTKMTTTKASPTTEGELNYLKLKASPWSQLKKENDLSTRTLIFQIKIQQIFTFSCHENDKVIFIVFVSAVLLADSKHRNQNEEDAKRPLQLHKNKLHKHYHHHKGNIGNAVVLNYSFLPSEETLRDSQRSFAFSKNGLICIIRKITISSKGT